MNDRGKAPPQPRGSGSRWFVASLIFWLTACPVHADPLRIATFNVAMSRAGPGLLLRDILSRKNPQIRAVVAIIAHVDPDILLLTGFDYDFGGAALGAFSDVLGAADADYPYHFALRPNTGRATGLDLDGDGRLGTPNDAQGYGAFAGQGGMAILSRLPIDVANAQDYSAGLWADLPGALFPLKDEAPLAAQNGRDFQRLSTTGHWAVPVLLPDGTALHLLAFHASPPVFDGPEDRNGRRNHDETRFWTLLLDGALEHPPPDRFVILGDANLDPSDGDGLPDAIAALLSHAAVQDPQPRSNGGRAAANPDHSGDPALDTVDWPDQDGPGNLRVDYVLPSARLGVLDAGVFWPAPDSPDADPPGNDTAVASRHRLVWVDIVP
ncbi:endonuclease/exonuclease/phosphatase family protein [Pseudogemmobacter sp. W21_MBD1_M6]|uniref:endonuclease/exonuclease/phosphatase family protein n=1 Tax=Pseudogemmobacter sp. W21_MBD1_M6 TaxID=3240271 RepID=UPI003F97633E